ncbi:uncharacterized protein LOC141613501 [Silene latifolia]|uniref:uncharacterized protein LOC141613501 n=1 Tax=Silene latifolia TaxID=37657 RepID=UPI003D776E74
MYSYWASMFILPKGVLNRVAVICRKFLWEWGTKFNKAPPLAWHKVRSPKKEGGLGLKNNQYWNAALIGKLVLWVSVRPDKLWVQWVHHVYLKDGGWTIGTKGYTVQSCYNSIMEQRSEVDWYKAVWRPLSIPKHSFVAWLISHQALMLKDRLFQYRVSNDNLCCICALAVENHPHLFQDYLYSRAVFQKVASLLECNLGQSDHLKQISGNRWSKQKKIVATSVALVVWYLV